MVLKAIKPRQRSRNSSLNYGLEEVKFIHSLKDLTIFFQKMSSYFPRLTGFYNLNKLFPPSLQIEPTNICNARCLCCPTWTSPRPKGYMEYSLFEKIINDAAQIGVRRIRLFLHGEPMLHPKIIDMLGYIKSKGLALNLTTNGIRFNKEIIKAILSSGVNSADHITFSILGYSKHVHEMIMPGVNHEKVMKNISDFLEERKEHRMNGPVIETIFYAMPDNEFEETQYFDYWRGKVDHARLGGRISESFAEYNQQEKKITPRMQTCTNIWERLTVLWNGDVTLCCQDVNGDWIIGNLKNQSIQEVWNSEQLLSIKRIHKEKRFRNFPFCYQCDM